MKRAWKLIRSLEWLAWCFVAAAFATFYMGNRQEVWAGCFALGAFFLSVHARVKRSAP